MITPRPILELREWQTEELAGVFLSLEDRKLAEQLGGEQGRLDIDELRTGVRVRTYSWVGLIHFENFDVRIEPKLTGDNLGLVEMIAFTSGLDALRRNIGTRHLEAEPADHLLDLLALLLAEACERIARGGLLFDYVQYESDLPVLRGRLLADRQVRHRLGQIDRLECRYDDHSSDIPENRILAAALQLCRSRVSHPAVRLRTHRLQALYSAACATVGFDPRSAREAMNENYHRLNKHYREAHELAWFIFDGLGIHDLLASASTRSFAFLLDMNRLFELFVLRLVSRILREKAYKVHLKLKASSIIWDSTHNRPYTQIFPDLIVESAPPIRRLVIDAKYKTYDEHRLGIGDVYQSFLYAYAFTGQQDVTPLTLLLYPASLPGTTPVRLHVRVADRSVGAAIQAVGIHIPQALGEVKSGVPGPVTEALMEVMERALPKSWSGADQP